MRRRTTPKFWMVMIFTTVLVFAVSIGLLQAQYSRGARELQRMQEYRDAQDLKVRELTDTLEYAQTDAYVIRAARDALGLIMPNEVRYVNGAN